MDCGTFHRKLEDYLEGGLDFSGRFSIERHAQQCLACGKDLSDAQKLSRMTKGLERVLAPANFEADVLRRIRASGLHRRPALWRLQFFWPDWLSRRSLAWGASAAALVVAGILFSLQWFTPQAGLVNQAGTVKGSPPQSAPFPPARDLSEGFSDPVAAAGTPVLPVLLSPDGSADPRFIVEGSESGLFGPQAATEYVDCAVPGPDGRRVIMRLPTTIRFRHVQPSEEYFLRNVSH